MLVFSDHYYIQVRYVMLGINSLKRGVKIFNSENILFIMKFMYLICMYYCNCDVTFCISFGFHVITLLFSTSDAMY